MLFYRRKVVLKVQTIELSNETNQSMPMSFIFGLFLMYEKKKTKTIVIYTNIASKIETGIKEKK